MVIDPILNKGLVGSRPVPVVHNASGFLNTASPSPCWDGSTPAADGTCPQNPADLKPAFDWNTFGLTIGKTAGVVNDFFSGLFGKKTNTTTMTAEQLAAYQAQLAAKQNQKILGMPATIGAIVVVAGIAAVVYGGYYFIKKSSVGAAAPAKA